MGIFDYFKRHKGEKGLLNESKNNNDVVFTEEDARELQYLRELYKKGKIPRLNEGEMDILKFTHGRDMKKFLKEEFEKNPTPKFSEDDGCPYSF